MHDLMSQGGTVVQWLALSPHSKRVLGSRVLGGGVCMFSSCLRGFFLILTDQYSQDILVNQCIRQTL